DRYLRFGYLAQDEHIQRYVDGLNFERDEIFGIYNRKLELIAMAHLAKPTHKSHQSCAEFGVSVLPSARGRGYGARLFERAAMHASNDGISLLFIHALTENIAMLKIARNAGAKVERDGSESEAFLQLPTGTFDSHMAEMIEEQVAQTDYHLKAQAKQFWSALSDVQKLRRNTKEAQNHPSP
ncbi:MAG: GNAT family N-acetyltransferase, partial [Rhodoferax sp.]